jgi:hypothetical protein
MNNQNHGLLGGSSKLCACHFIFLVVSRPTARQMSRTRRKPGLPERSEGVGSIRLLAGGERQRAAG